jgi:DNA gyrase subunit A
MAVDCLVMGKTEGIRFRSKKSREEAEMLMFTERQANAILDMRLVKLIGLEIEALEKEYAETQKQIERYRLLLDDHDEMAKLLISELDEMKKAYGRERRTLLTDAEEIVIEEKKVEEEEVVFLLDRFGYAKLLDVSVYEKNKEAADADNKYVFRIMNTDKVALFTDIGKMHTIKVLDVPMKKLRDKGVPIDNLTNFTNRTEDIVWVCPMEMIAGGKVFMATKMGQVKLTQGAEFVSSVRTVAATKLQENDSVIMVGMADTCDTVFLLSGMGLYIRFALSEVPEMKKAAVGVRGIRLAEGDEVTAAYLLGGQGEFAIDYNGKKLTPGRVKISKRGGKGTRR